MGCMRLCVSGYVTLHECPYRSTLPSWPRVSLKPLGGDVWGAAAPRAAFLLCRVKGKKKSSFIRCSCPIREMKGAGWKRHSKIWNLKAKPEDWCSCQVSLWNSGAHFYHLTLEAVSSWHNGTTGKKYHTSNRLLKNSKHQSHLIPWRSDRLRVTCFSVSMIAASQWWLNCKNRSHSWHKSPLSSSWHELIGSFWARASESLGSHPSADRKRSGDKPARPSSFYRDRALHFTRPWEEDRGRNRTERNGSNKQKGSRCSGSRRQTSRLYDPETLVHYNPWPL